MLLELLKKLTPSNIIEIFGIISSLIASLVAINISVKALKQAQITNEQNAYMLKESTRPYITIYLDAITICEQDSFFVLKNFGHSPGRITVFEYDPILRELEQDPKSQILNEQYDFVKGITLAPGQSKMLKCDVPKLPKDILTFRIEYVFCNDRYEELVELNVKNYIHVPVTRPNTKILPNNDRQVQSLREIIDRLV